MKNAGSRQIAERYVKALFDVAADARDAVEHDLNQLGAAFKESPEFQHFLTNPLYSREEQQKALAAALAKMKAQAVTQQFITMLIKQKRLPVLPDIIAMFSEWASKARGELRAELIATTPLSVRVVDMVSETLSKAYGKKVIVTMRHDPSLLGGAVIKIGSQQLDSSLAGKMRRLKQALQAA